MLFVHISRSSLDIRRLTMQFARFLKVAPSTVGHTPSQIFSS